MKREIKTTIFIDWENYEDVSDELVLEDTGIYDNLKEGVTIEIVKEEIENTLCSEHPTINQIKKVFAEARIIAGPQGTIYEGQTKNLDVEDVTIYYYEGDKPNDETQGYYAKYKHDQGKGNDVCLYNFYHKTLATIISLKEK